MKRRLIAKHSSLLCVLLLTACGSNYTNQASQASSFVASASKNILESETQVLAKPSPKETAKKVYPWIFQANLEEIDPNLLAEGSKLQISYVKESESSPKGKCYYEANYPQISGLKDTVLQEEINSKLWMLITKEAYLGFQKRLNDQSSRCSYSERLGANSPYPQFTSTIERCRITFARATLVSLVCEEWHMPGAYPLIYQRGATFNLATGKTYSIDELWKPDVDYKRDIEPFFFTKVIAKDRNGVERVTNVLPASGKHLRSAPYLSTNGDYYLADRCENRENTLPAFINPPDLAKTTCIIFAKAGSGGLRNVNLSITTPEVAKFLNPEIAEIVNRK